jgi:hypothetical protein
VKKGHGVTLSTVIAALPGVSITATARIGAARHVAPSAHEREPRVFEQVSGPVGKVTYGAVLHRPGIGGAR